MSDGSRVLQPEQFDEGCYCGLLPDSSPSEPAFIEVAERHRQLCEHGFGHGVPATL